MIASELVPLLERGVVVRLPDFDLARDKSSVAGAGGRAGSGGGGRLWRTLPSPLQFLRVILPVCRLVPPAARTPLLQSTCPKASGHRGPLCPCYGERIAAQMPVKTPLPGATARLQRAVVCRISCGQRIDLHASTETGFRVFAQALN